MKGRFRAAICFAVFALLTATLPGYCKDNPANSSAKSKKRSLQAPAAHSGPLYVVRKGDSLIKIARMFKTTPEALRSSNGLQGSFIKIGQKLRIPSAPVVVKEDRPKSAGLPPPDLFISAGSGEGSEDAGQPLRLRLVKAGFEWIGVRYRPSGGSETSGFDCSGLVKSLFSKFNIELPRSSREQFKQGEKVDRDKLEIGDLLFFSSGGDLPTHVGIYVGDNKFLHAARTAQQVIISDLSKFWNSMRYLGARRIMDLWGETKNSPEKDSQP